MSKLLEDPKIAALVEREVKKAVRLDRTRISAALKEVKAEYAEADDRAVKTTANKVIATANKIVRDVA